MSRLEFPDCSFDIVACLEGIEHVSIEVGAKFLREAYRILRPGGQLFVTSPHPKTGGHSGNPFHVHEYRTEELRAAPTTFKAL
jgi:ubiquinone/menaquinone biosynthesis C-methylase UbiE